MKLGKTVSKNANSAWILEESRSKLLCKKINGYRKPLYETITSDLTYGWKCHFMPINCAQAVVCFVCAACLLIYLYTSFKATPPYDALHSLLVRCTLFYGSLSGILPYNSKCLHTYSIALSYVLAFFRLGNFVYA